MGTQADLNVAADAIRTALEKMVEGFAPPQVSVFESSPNNLRAVVVSDFFKGIGVTDRQNRIWKHLRKHVSDEYLARLKAVHPYDTKEYAAVSPANSTTSPQESITKIAPPLGGDEKNA